MQSTSSLIFIDGIPNTYHWRGGREKKRKCRYQWCCKHTHSLEDLSTRFCHTTFFPHCSVVTQEELEHRLLDQLSEGLQASEAQLREEMARKVSGGVTIFVCHHCMSFIDSSLFLYCMPSSPFPVTQFNLISICILFCELL